MNKTTSTDIEELREKLREEVTEVLSDYPFRDFYREAVDSKDKEVFLEKQKATQSWIDVCTNSIYELFAPHLSNKSELKKEAVIKKIRMYQMGFVKSDGNDGFEYAPEYGVIEDLLAYLSSNEKNSSKLGDL